MELFKQKKIDATELAGLPTWMSDTELCTGRVASSSQYRQTAPGMPANSIPVPVGFLKALWLLSEKKAALGGNSVSAMAEAEIAGYKYATAITFPKDATDTGKFSALCREKNLKGKADLPQAMYFLLLIAPLMNDVEFSREFSALENAADDNERKFHVATMADNLYFQYTGNMKGIVDCFDKNMMRLTEVKAKDPRYSPSVQLGTFDYFPNKTGGAASQNVMPMFKAAMTAREFQGKFAVVQDSELTPEEKQAVPVLSDRMVITEQHVQVAETIQKSLLSGGPFLFSDYLFRGAPGGGKSTFVRILAAGLNLPYYSDVIRTDSETDIFSGYYVPSTNNATAENPEDLPNIVDMVCDPVTSYFRMTGVQKLDASPEECQKVWEESIKAGAAEDGNRTGAKLKFVEGLIPKLRRPCLIFYDEVTVAQNPGLMAALNTLMDDQRVFTLTSGEVVHRHPKTVMTFAGNFGNVEGCREPNRAWQDRCAEIIDIVPPSTEQLKGQLIAMTGWDAVKNANIPIDTFVSILPELAEISEEYYGTCSVRGVAAWLAKAMMSGDVFAAAETTIITHASNDATCQAELRAKIQDKFIL